MAILSTYCTPKEMYENHDEAAGLTFYCNDCLASGKWKMSQIWNVINIETSQYITISSIFVAEKQNYIEMMLIWNTCHVWSWMLECLFHAMYRVTSLSWQRFMYMNMWIMHEAYIMRVYAPTSLYHWPCMERGWRAVIPRWKYPLQVKFFLL